MLSRMEWKILIWTALICLALMVWLPTWPKVSNRVIWIACSVRMPFCKDWLGIKIF